MFLFSLLAFGSLFFWIAFIVISLLIIAFDAAEKEGKAFVTLLIFGGLFLAANPTTLAAIKANPLLLLFAVLGYLALGVVTAVIKWYFFLLNVRDVVRENPPTVRVRNPDWTYQSKGIAEYLSIPATVDDPANISVRGRDVAFPVKVSRFKARIIGWMTYWPWVAVWTLLDDPIRRLFQRIYVTIAGQLQKMADKILTQVASE